MARKQPKRALPATTYGELEQYAEKFASGFFNLLIVSSDGGLGKSYHFREAVGEDVTWIEGSATAFGMYTELYRNQGRPVVIDDVDDLCSDKAAVRLLKCLCQTDPVKRVAWYTAAVGKNEDDIPKAFNTTSKVAILCNDWSSVNKNVEAVEDRGHRIEFTPAPSEVHRKASEFFWDEEVFRWFGEHLPLLPHLSLRMYHRASELKDAGFDWQTLVLVENGLADKTALAAKLRFDSSYKSEEERVTAFKDGGGGSRRSYFYHVKKLRGKGKTTPLDIRLQNPRSSRKVNLRVVREMEA